jgi:hypothetical protein
MGIDTDASTRVEAALSGQIFRSWTAPRIARARRQAGISTQRGFRVRGNLVSCPRLSARLPEFPSPLPSPRKRSEEAI